MRKKEMSNRAVEGRLGWPGRVSAGCWILGKLIGDIEGGYLQNFTQPAK
jgi:hypothetical protein